MAAQRSRGIPLALSLKLGRRVRNVGRMAQIVNVFARHGFWTFIRESGLDRWLTPDQFRKAQAESTVEPAPVREMELPERLRKAFEELGPAFVKLGQVLAVREDLLPPEYLTELRKLHTQVEPLPYAVIRQRLQEELGPDKLANFVDINPEPLAAGSIAQVHQAKLASGEDVVIKVQRPGIQQQIETDLQLIETFASIIEKYSAELRSIRLSTMAAELSRAMSSELDFIREAGSTSKFAANFRSVEYVVIPEVFWAYTTPRVLTMSYLKGTSPWDKSGIQRLGLDPVLLVEQGLEMFLKMVFVDGLYHGDLHPGNLLVLPENRVGVLDFGLVVRISRATREHLAGLLVALVAEDFERMVQHFVELSEPSPDFDLEGFQHDIANAVAPFVGLRLKAIRSGGVLFDLARIAARHGVPMPQELIMFIKTLVSFEGIGLHLNPDFDIFSTCGKFTSKIVKDLYSPEKLRDQAIVLARDAAALLRHAPLQLRRLLKAALDGDLRIQVDSESVEILAEVLDRTSARLALGLISSGLFVAGGIMAHATDGRTMFGIPVPALLAVVAGTGLAFLVVVSILRKRSLF
ncbi:AarF/ABC1/UbiB kinase family protein [bacterium]|nr:AarF/ABC1/UbiB kinase family protein [bacterium]